MLEARVTGNIGISETQMILFEAGYGWHDGDLVPGHDSGFTNARLRWFKVQNMAYDKDFGYRGNSLQVDLQLAGSMKGSNGQNVLAVGALPTFALGGHWNLYFGISGVASWDKGFANFNGAGINASPKFVCSPDSWWPGA